MTFKQKIKPLGKGKYKVVFIRKRPRLTLINWLLSVGTVGRTLIQNFITPVARTLLRVLTLIRWTI